MRRMVRANRYFHIRPYRNANVWTELNKSGRIVRSGLRSTRPDSNNLYGRCASIICAESSLVYDRSSDGLLEVSKSSGGWEVARKFEISNRPIPVGIEKWEPGLFSNPSSDGFRGVAKGSGRRGTLFLPVYYNGLDPPSILSLGVAITALLIWRNLRTI